MSLAEFVAQQRKRAFEALKEGRPPVDAQYDEALFKEARDRGQPQMGPVVYYPDRVVLDFIYPAEHASALVLPVTVVSPEPIVYMPVPEWVVEQVWQGEVFGSYRFESEAVAMLEKFADALKRRPDSKEFGPEPKLTRG